MTWSWALRSAVALLVGVAVAVPHHHSSARASATVGRATSAGVSTSNNWGGALVSSGSYTKVYASVRVPDHAPCATTSLSGHSMWVGLGGWDRDRKMLQNGIASTGNRLHTYYIWYEATALGLDTTELVVPGVTVYPGDTVNLAITWNPGTRRVTFYWHDVTPGHAFTRSVTPPSFLLLPPASFYSGATAEAIDERPLKYGRYTQLRRYTSPATWSSVKVARNGGALSPWRSEAHHTGLQIYQNGVPLQGFKAGTSTTSFSNTWRSCGQLGP